MADSRNAMEADPIAALRTLRIGAMAYSSATDRRLAIAAIARDATDIGMALDALILAVLEVARQLEEGTPHA